MVSPGFKCFLCSQRFKFQNSKRVKRSKRKIGPDEFRRLMDFFRPQIRRLDQMKSHLSIDAGKAITKKIGLQINIIPKRVEGGEVTKGMKFKTPEVLSDCDDLAGDLLSTSHKTAIHYPIPPV